MDPDHRTQRPRFGKHRLSTYVDAVAWRQFVDRAAVEGVSPADALRRLVLRDLAQAEQHQR